MKRADLELFTWIELNHVLAGRALPKAFEKGKIGFDEATPIFDPNGEELFVRVPLRSGSNDIGFADIALDARLGEPLIAISSGVSWDEALLRRLGAEAARRLGIDGVDEAKARFVAFSFPKVALQFLDDGEEAAMLELYSWEPVPPSTREERHYAPPGNFERWSYLDEMPDDEQAERIARFEARLSRWREGLTQRPEDISVLRRADFTRYLGEIPRFFLGRTRDLHYGTRDSDHRVCFELRGQQTNVWCVAASTQMLLDFYRYEYDQVRVAQELCLGTIANPIGLPYSRDGDVVTSIEHLSCYALDASMTTTPTWNEFESEIDANRPVISFIPGHSRTVAGYTRSTFSMLGQPPFRGLLVYDPWPPNSGVITRWENFNVSSYRRTFTAKLYKV